MNNSKAAFEVNYYYLLKVVYRIRVEQAENLIDTIMKNYDNVNTTLLKKQIREYAIKK